jgi:hypothetical protein
MAIGSGLAAQLGVSKESVYGTFVVPAEFFEFDSENMNKQPQFLSSTGLKAGHMAPPVTRHKQTVQSAGGDVTLKVPNKGFGRWLNMLHGNAVTPVIQGAGPAYLQTHNIGLTSPFGKSLSVQVGKPGTSGTVQPFTYLGAKVLSVTFSCDLGGELQAVLTLDAQAETTAKSAGGGLISNQRWPPLTSRRATSRSAARRWHWSDPSRSPSRWRRRPTATASVPRR